MTSTSLFFVFLGYSFVNLIMDCKTDEGIDESLIQSIAAVVGNYVGSAVTFAAFYFVSICFTSLFR